MIESGYNPGCLTLEHLLLAVLLLHLPLKKEFIIVVMIITDEKTESQRGK